MVKADDFDLMVYRKKRLTPKLRFFFEYLDSKFEKDEDGKFDNEYFELLEKEDFLDSLQQYITKNSPARQTANDYIRDIDKFFDFLFKEYGIRNAVFFDNEEEQKFKQLKQPIIEKLPEQEQKECASDEDYEKLNLKLNDYVENVDLDLVLEEVENYHIGKRKKLKYYNRFVSVLPTKLVMQYALKSNRIARIKIENVDIEARILKVNNFNITMDSEMIQLFKDYLLVRARIIELSHSTTDLLFIKISGNSFWGKNNQLDANAFSFCHIFQNGLGIFQSQTFCYKRIIELAQKGADIRLLSELTEIDPTKIKSLCENIKITPRIQLEKLLLEASDNRQKDIRKGMMRCTFCGKYAEAISDNWILIQVGETQEKYLACRQCGGNDGKYRY